MSIHCFSVVWKIKDPDLDPCSRLVLLSLADRANDLDRIAWPSIADTVTRTGLAERTVKQKLRKLETKGLIRCVHRGGGMRHPKFGRASAYRINVGEGESPASSVRRMQERAVNGGESCMGRVQTAHPGGASPAPVTTKETINSPPSSIITQEEWIAEIRNCDWLGATFDKLIRRFPHCAPDLQAMLIDRLKEGWHTWQLQEPVQRMLMQGKIQHPVQYLEKALSNALNRTGMLPAGIEI